MREDLERRRIRILNEDLAAQIHEAEHVLRKPVEADREPAALTAVQDKNAPPKFGATIMDRCGQLKIS